MDASRISGPLDLPCEDLTPYVQIVSPLPSYNGGFADVYTGVWSKGEKSVVNVAVKVFRSSKHLQETDSVKKQLIGEVAVWRQLSHDNILPFLGLAIGRGRNGLPALVSPWCNQGTVMDYLTTHPAANRLQIMLGIIDGLRYIHQQDIVHGDLKPSNILISDNGHPLLCDFGSSRLISHRGFTSKTLGTVRYQAPELFEEDAKCTQPSDIYALGMTFSEIWTGFKPHALASSDADIIIQVVIRNIRPRCPDFTRETRLVWVLFEECWKTKPGERLKANQVMDSLKNIRI